jgi:hypothetical protein
LPFKWVLFYRGGFGEQASLTLRVVAQGHRWVTFLGSIIELSIKYGKERVRTSCSLKTQGTIKKNTW